MLLKPLRIAASVAETFSVPISLAASSARYRLTSSENLIPNRAAKSRETLLDAQAHPENYPNLIVRVWGWSGYFVELDRIYQDHVISRTEFGV